MKAQRIDESDVRFDFWFPPSFGKESEFVKFCSGLPIYGNRSGPRLKGHA